MLPAVWCLSQEAAQVHPPFLDAMVASTPAAAGAAEVALWEGVLRDSFAALSAFSFLEADKSAGAWKRWVIFVRFLAFIRELSVAISSLPSSLILPSAPRPTPPPTLEQAGHCDTVPCPQALPGRAAGAGGGGGGGAPRLRLPEGLLAGAATGDLDAGFVQRPEPQRAAAHVPCARVFHAAQVTPQLLLLLLLLLSSRCFNVRIADDHLLPYPHTPLNH